MNTEASVDSKKRRGRKPKVVSTMVSPIPEQNAASQNDSSSLPTNKRGRKPKVVFAFDSQQSAKDEDDIDVILKLKMQNSITTVNAVGHCQEIDKENDEGNVCAFNEGCMTQFSSIPNNSNVSENKHCNQQTCNIEGCNNISDNHQSNVSKVGTNKVVELLKEFEEKSKNGEWPLSTNISCYWCCHKFETPPVGLPCKYTDAKYFVTGCFCSLECAAAYNVMFLRDSNMEERMNLLSMLSRDLGYDTLVKPAPPREMLQMFGGNMAIDDFRGCFHKRKSININFPPMVVLINQMEEVNDCDVSNKLKYVPLDMDRIDKYKEKLKLCRSIPVNANKNTLENVMQFSIKTCV